LEIREGTRELLAYKPFQNPCCADFDISTRKKRKRLLNENDC